MSGHAGRPRRARRRGGRRRPAPRPPLHRRRVARARRWASLRGLWDQGVASSVDLLGEATVTEAEADRYAAPLRRGDRACSPRPPARWPARPMLEADGVGPLPRANVCVEDLGADAAAAPRRPGARPARRRRAAAAAAARRPATAGAHLHIDMESLDSREAVLELVLAAARRGRVPRRAVGRARAAGLPARFARAAGRRSSPGRGPRRAHAAADRPPGQGRLLGPRARPGPPARLAGAGVRGQARVRPQLRAAHAAAARRAPGRCGWRSPRTTCARSRTRSPTTGSPAARTPTSSCRSCAGSATSSSTPWPARGFRVRTYCPVGDLVAGMAYLVRRLLENTCNDSFLSAQARGVPLEQLLAAP